MRKFLGIQDEEEEPGGETKKAEPEKVLKKPASRGRLKPPRPDGKKKESKGVDKEKGKKDKKEPAKEGKKKRGKEPREGEAVPSVSRAALKEKLAKLRERLTGTRGLVEDAFAEEDEDGSEESVVPVDSESPQDELDTGTALVARSSKKKRKAEARDGVPRRTAAMRALEDTNVGLSSLPQAQLVQQALAAGSGSKKEKKQKEGQAAHELARILNRTLKKKDKRKKDKKDKEKKKKKKKKKGKGSSDPSSSSGAMSSWETSSNGSSNKELQKSSSSDEEYEAPLRKRAKNKPGSILSLLVEHARDQLDQSSMVGLPDRESKSLTDGIQLTSYFQILLKSKLTGAMAQQREMYHLAVCMDLLRQGKLSGVGDALAARFLYLHQSVLDGNWTAARHMELYPLEESSAAGTSIILQTRRHAKLAAKAQGLDVEGSRWKGPLRPLWRRCFRLKRREERKERKRKRQGSWQEQLVESGCRTRQRRRVEEHAGPEERQVTKTDEVGKLALALEEFWTTASDPVFMEPEQSL